MTTRTTHAATADRRLSDPPAAGSAETLRRLPDTDAEVRDRSGWRMADHTVAVRESLLVAEHEPRCTSCRQPLGPWDIDRLTGVLNRWGWDDQAPNLLARSLGRRESVALLIVDLDWFKQINDTCGHIAGDAALRSVAGVLRSVTQRDDLVGRFGGDEFVVLLPSTDLDDAVHVARKIRTGVGAIEIGRAVGDAPPVMSCSASVGLAVCRPGRSFDMDLDALLLDADAALLAAKRHGRGRTCIACPNVEGDDRRSPQLQLAFDPPLLR